MNPTVGLFLVLLSILANAFFAGVETGFTSARRVRLIHWARNGRRGASGAADLARDRENAVVSAVVGNNVAIVAGTAVATAVAVALLGTAGETVAGVTMAALNIVLGEILPKTAFRARPEEMLVWSAPVLRVTNLLLAPLRIAAVAAARAVLWLLRVEAADESAVLTRESLLRSFALSHEYQQLEEREDRLLRRFIRNSHRSIADVLTPMDRVAHVGVDARVRDVMEQVRLTGHSRLPVLGPGGEVLGLILFRDLQGLDPGMPAISEMRDAVRLSASMGLDEGIGILTDRRVGLAVVIADHGVACGIVTLEDLLEPLLGDILDEHDLNVRTQKL